ncbi:Apocytochrome F [Synechococcus sp. PCC 7502]|uniref:apocytochrome f n=1 Tax=Synechococcus sp. PCC 7502 TaxID=1173263 RepID=UPI00029F9D01|nr:apocytochrome f [Synechococcus sp. PCC 7502]AFY75294.1 Apocytochrome F [Synechococcus sp. PCC 7502]
MKRNLFLAIALVVLIFNGLVASPAQAYPYYAQAAYENPREATGRIVCANCHLAQKPTQLELPQSVKPDTVFEAVVKIPYDHSQQQVLADGSKGGLNVGAVIVLPEGFKIAPEDRLSEELKEKTKDIYYQPYSDTKENIVIVGPIPGDEYSEIIFPVLSPDPNTDKNVSFLKYPVHVGANRGRGQVYPTGAKSNNVQWTAPVAGTVSKITEIPPNEEEDTYGGYAVTIQPENGKAVTEEILAGANLLVSEGQVVKAGEALTSNPNVGGFGQVDGEIVLQDPRRIQWLLAFFASIFVTQIMLVLKKKQVEKVQAVELNF